MSRQAIERRVRAQLRDMPLAELEHVLAALDAGNQEGGRRRQLRTLIIDQIDARVQQQLPPCEQQD